MTPGQRSLAGLIIALVLTPVLLGLIACLPVPLGDPARSRIDPALGGVWLMAGDDPTETNVNLVLWEPYDKHTWLVTLHEVDFDACDGPGENGDDADGHAESERPDTSSYAALIDEIRGLPRDCLVGDETESYKVWRTRIGGKWFVTWEPKAVFDDKYGFEPEFWFAFRIDSADENRVSLRLVDANYEGFEESDVARKLKKPGAARPRDPRALKTARRAVERMIARHVDDDSLYAERYWFYRVQAEDYDLFFEDDASGP